jgi:hypothetical protein
MVENEMARLNRNGPGGSWQETAFTPIDLPFTIENLKSVLECGLETESKYTHQQIADWCVRFWLECDDGSLSDIDDPFLDIAADIALDVDAQWGLYLINEYSFDELKSMDFSRVVLPYEWFNNWQNQLTINEI